MRKLIFAICLLLSWSAPSLAQSPAAASPAAEQVRQTADLSTGWRFHYGEAGEAPAAPGFDDSAWEKISVPHTWNTIGEYAEARSASANNAQGVGWYRLSFNAPAAAMGKRHYLDFAAVGSIADVWVNGVHVGQHKGAFSRFRFDVTAQWKPGAVNLIAVKADNSKPAVGSSTEHVIPLAGDFFIHGGIYRGVSLITANDVGIDLLDMGGPGVYAQTSELTESVTQRAAFVQVVTRLRNNGSKARALTVVTSLADATGSRVSGRTLAVPVKAQATGMAVSTLNLFLPHLWDGPADPYLYQLTVQVWDRKRLLDSVTQPFGIRSFKFDANEGFSLNGKYLKLHGVSRHQDRAGRGWALTRADHAEDMALIREMGANTVRHAHYQHADEWSDEADKAGMIVWAEVPYVTSPSLSGGQGSPELWANAEQQLRELIRQNYNHPSIAMWSVGNEVDIAKGFGMAGDPPKSLPLLQHLAKVAKEEDRLRPTTFADCCEEQTSMQTSGEKLAGTADLIGYNRYYGWYMPQPLDARKQLGEKLDHFHAKHAALPMSISEYGAGGAFSQHSDNVRSGYVNYIGRPQPEGFESFVHEENWPVIRERKYIFASWVWNMFDFVSDMRKEGDAIDLNTKGLVSFDRKTRKDAFYYYKAQWNPEPMLHITGMRHADRPYPLIEVKAYSTAPSAALTVNGAAIGTATCADKICIWRDVALQPGANVIGVTARDGVRDLYAQATFNGPDPAQGLRIDSGDSAGRMLGGQRFGSDNFVTGGEAKVLNMGSFGGRSDGAPRSVSAPQPALYEYWREGETFSYAIPVPNGRWNVTVHSFEPRNAGTEGQAMTIRAQGRATGAAFNIARAAGGPLKGVTRTFAVTVQDGELKLDFAGRGGKAVVAAIEVMK